ncbi:MAG: hypothetical protein IKH64_04280 [Prevotella sp.]|nr:hypothetical protein [Prevotella sp.]
MLDRAGTVINDDPDSALAILDCMDENHLSRSQRMKRLLLLTNAQNKCDTIFRSDSIQRILVDYYEHHGSANDRMLAHYLLGRAYYDMGEMPMALNAYQLALADTTETEHDYYQLTRITAQMSKIYYHQNLLNYQIDYINKSVKYALLGKDTLGAINNYVQKAKSYDMLGVSDSVISICENASRLFVERGLERQSSQMMALLALHYIKRGEFEKAKQSLDVYRTRSGFFDDDNNIVSNRIIYYSIMGEYYTSIEKYDSAEYFFRKELHEGKDFNNQNAGSRGLALLFQRIHQPDSAAKYALYSYAMNDSVYAHMATAEVEKMRSMYDYTRYQNLAYKAETESNQKTTFIKGISFVFILILLFMLYIVQRYKQKRMYEKSIYKRRIDELEKTQMDILILRQHEEDYQDIIEEKERNIEELQEQINKYQQNHKQRKNELQTSKENSPLFKKIQKLEASGQKLSLEDLQKLRQYVIEHYPTCYKFISDNQYNLNVMEFNTCILIRLGYAPKVISHFIDCSPAYISKIRITLLKRMYGIEGKPHDFDQRITLLD